jgi:hypothetical protein
LAHLIHLQCNDNSDQDDGSKDAKRLAELLATKFQSSTLESVLPDFQKIAQLLDTQP